MRSISEMVTAIESRYPAVLYKDGGSRAQAAAELLKSGSVSFLGNQNGRAYWAITGSQGKVYTVHLGPRGCGCFDRHAPHDAQGHRLCRHVLAASIDAKLRKQGNDRLTALFATFTGERILLTVARLFADGEDAKRITGYHIVGQAPVTLAHSETIEFDNDQLIAAMNAAGWAMPQPPQRANGLNYTYRLVPAGEAPTVVGMLKSMHVVDVEARQDRERVRSMGRVAAKMAA